MRNPDLWKPTKFSFKKGKLKISEDIKQVSISSRLMGRIIAAFYNDVIRLYAKGDLLDIGCGNVPLYEFYSKFVNSVTCVDWENSIHQNHNIDVFCDLNKKIPLNSGVYNTIIASDVIEHIRKPENLFKEISRLLAPEGYLILNVPFFYWIHEEPFDYFRYTKYTLKSMTENVGLTVVSLIPMGGVPEIITDILAKNISPIKWGGFTISKLIQYLTWKFINTKTGKNYSLKTGEKFPLGYFLIAKKCKA